MKQFLAALLFINFTGLITSCGSDDDAIIIDCVDTVSLTTDVMPVITSNCALSGCHKGSRSPDLSTEAGVTNNASRIRAQVAGGDMPPTGSGVLLTVEERTAILCWIQQGAPAN